jgi:glyoxylase-like metal-dependent hydrolase (beta-lactamase superfamily II)
MRASLVVLVPIIGLICWDGVHAQQPRDPVREMSLHRVAGNVYMLDGSFNGAGNVAVLVGSDGLVLVDAQEEPVHRRVLAALKSLSDRPVRYVVDTHCHGDHTGGNAAFRREGATLVAHRNVRERLATQSTCGPPAGTGLPTVTFDSELTLYADDEEIRIIKLPAGHTDGDVMVYFRKANVVATGDAFFSNALGGPDPSNNGTMTGVIDEMRTIESAVAEDAKVIPGHGAQASMKDVRRTRQVLQGMRDAVQQQIRAGKTLDEIRKMNVLSAWKDHFGAPCVPNVPCDHLDSESYLRNFYRALTMVSVPSK